MVSTNLDTLPGGRQIGHCCVVCANLDTLPWDTNATRELLRARDTRALLCRAARDVCHAGAGGALWWREVVAGTGPLWWEMWCGGREGCEGLWV